MCYTPYFVGGAFLCCDMYHYTIIIIDIIELSLLSAIYPILKHCTYLI
jgi:hypothetical protein